MLVTFATHTLIMKEDLSGLWSTWSKNVFWLIMSMVLASKVFSSMAVFDMLRKQLRSVVWEIGAFVIGTCISLILVYFVWQKQSTPSKSFLGSVDEVLAWNGTTGWILGEAEECYSRRWVGQERCHRIQGCSIHLVFESWGRNAHTIWAHLQAPRWRRPLFQTRNNKPYNWTHVSPWAIFASTSSRARPVDPGKLQCWWRSSVNIFQNYNRLIKIIPYGLI